MTPLEFQLWLKDGHQSLCLFVVKEYLCWCAEGSTAVQMELRHRYKWEAFRSSVFEAMEKARAMIEGGEIFNSVDAFLLGINRSQVKHMFRQRKHTFVECLDGLVQKEVVAEGADSVYQIIIRVEPGDFYLVTSKLSRCSGEDQERVHSDFCSVEFKEYCSEHSARGSNLSAPLYQYGETLRECAHFQSTETVAEKTGGMPFAGCTECRRRISPRTPESVLSATSARASNHL